MTSVCLFPPWSNSRSGKSTFLLWLLIRLLALQLPILLQVHSGGVSQLADPEDLLVYGALELPPNNDPKQKFGVLVDTNRSLLEPASIFERNEISVVNSTPPHFDHFGWLNKICHEYFHMKTRNFSETLQVYVDLAPVGLQSLHSMQPPVYWNNSSLRRTTALVFI